MGICKNNIKMFNLRLISLHSYVNLTSVCLIIRQKLYLLVPQSKKEARLVWEKKSWEEVDEILEGERFQVRNEEIICKDLKGFWDLQIRQYEMMIV